MDTVVDTTRHYYEYYLSAFSCNPHYDFIPSTGRGGTKSLHVWDFPIVLNFETDLGDAHRTTNHLLCLLPGVSE